MKKEKKALSPVITTILLIALVLVLAAIIFLWARGFVQEQVTKFNRPIDEKCQEVELSGSVSGSSIILTNIGSVPVYKVGVRKSGGARTVIKAKEVNIIAGGTETINLAELGITIEDTTEINIIPILLGKSEKDEIIEYTCSSKTDWETIRI